MLTIEPGHAAYRIKKNKMKLAMAVGTRRHYRLDEIRGRHFVETARAVKMPDPLVRRAIDEILTDCEAAFDIVAQALPDNFPGHINDITRRAALARLGSLDTAMGERRD